MVDFELRQLGNLLVFAKRLASEAASPVTKKKATKTLGTLAFLLGCTLLRGNIHKPIETGKTLILLF